MKLESFLGILFGFVNGFDEREMRLGLKKF